MDRQNLLDDLEALAETLQTCRALSEEPGAARMLLTILSDWQGALEIPFSDDHEKQRKIIVHQYNKIQEAVETIVQKAPNQPLDLESLSALKMLHHHIDGLREQMSMSF